ncbi:MAG: polymer-forming cytoskeletal protein, partial [Lachnospiraceae bacterium]|nr:polymer-forming cytoskeletal protein [Lachnospiraceae bacterium]
EEDESEEVTTISKGVKLEGNLSSKGSVELLGDVTGDVNCQGKLLVYGTIIGNPTAAEIYANSARIEGNVKSDGSVKIGTGSIIIGNINASSVVIGGAVKGDIDVNGPVIIDSTAVVVGNIKSRSVQLNNGAVIDGFVSQCYAGVDVDGLFASKNEEQKSKKK